MSRRTLFFAFSVLVVASMILAACTQPTPETVTVKETVQVVETQVVTEEKIVVVTATAPASLPAEPRTLVICLGQEPDTLYQFKGSMLAKSQVLEATYDGPIDSRSFDYQPVILEKLPSIADGDAVINVVDVLSGDPVIDNDGNPVKLEAGVKVRPAGCRSADCAIDYDGTSALQMDQLSATFKMLPGLVWSDGTPLTTKDSVYSFNLQGDPDTPTSKYTFQHTASYEALDDVTVVWTGMPGFMDSTYFTNFFVPSPEHLWGQYTPLELVTAVDSNAMYTGWGPYIIDEWVKGDRITLHKNPNYFRAAEGLPVFDNLVYRIMGENSNANIAAILSGECDIVDQTSHLQDQSELLLELQEKGQVNAAFVTGTSYEHADFNIRPLEGAGFAGWDTDGDGLGPFGDVRLRQAILMCMDRQAVVDTVMFGRSVVLHTYLPPEHPQFNANVKQWPFDVAAASALLDEIGWVDDDGDPATPRVAKGVTGVPDGTLLEFSYETTSATQRQQVTQVLAESMAQCGIKVKLNYIPATEWFANAPEGKLFGRKFDLGEFSTSTGVTPPCDLYGTWQIPGDPAATDADGKPLYPQGYGGWNDPGYSNPEYDAVCNAALQALPGETAYEENHLKAQEIFANELPVAPLYLNLKLAASRPDMCNFFVDPTHNSEMWNIEAFDYGECAGQ